LGPFVCRDLQESVRAAGAFERPTGHVPAKNRAPPLELSESTWQRQQAPDVRVPRPGSHTRSLSVTCRQKRSTNNVNDNIDVFKQISPPAYTPTHAGSQSKE
jgi:hypothetical protein